MASLPSARRVGRVAHAEALEVDDLPLAGDERDRAGELASLDLAAQRAAHPLEPLRRQSDRFRLRRRQALGPHGGREDHEAEQGDEGDEASHRGPPGGRDGHQQSQRTLRRPVDVVKRPASGGEEGGGGRGGGEKRGGRGGGGGGGGGGRRGGGGGGGGKRGGGEGEEGSSDRGAMSPALSGQEVRQEEEEGANFALHLLRRLCYATRRIA